MAVVELACAVVRRTGALTLLGGNALAGDTYAVPGGLLLTTSGIIHVWGKRIGGGNPFGASFRWVKGVITGGPTGMGEGALPDVPTTTVLFNTMAANLYTTFTKDTANAINVYFDGSQLYIQNGFTLGVDVELCYDITIIDH